MSRSSKAWPVCEGSEFSFLNVRYLRNRVSMTSGDDKDRQRAIGDRGRTKSGSCGRGVDVELKTRKHLVVMRKRSRTDGSKARLRLKDACCRLAVESWP